jgi:hypothetical protein
VSDELDDRVQSPAGGRQLPTASSHVELHFLAGNWLAAESDEARSADRRMGLEFSDPWRRRSVQSFEDAVLDLAEFRI